MMTFVFEILLQVITKTWKIEKEKKNFFLLITYDTYLF